MLRASLDLTSRLYTSLYKVTTHYYVGYVHIICICRVRTGQEPIIILKRKGGGREGLFLTTSLIHFQKSCKKRERGSKKFG